MITAPKNLQKEYLNILLIGAGGTGSYLATLIGQMAYSMAKMTDNERVIKLAIMDDDVVSDSNIGRANFYPCDIGLPKAEVLADRLKYGLGINVSSKIEKMDESYNFLARQYDMVITCVDTGRFRYEFGAFNKDLDSSILWVDVGNGANDGQVVVGHLGSPGTDKYPNVYDLFGELLLEADDDDTPSCSLEEALHRQDMGVNYHAASRTFNAIWSLIRYNKLHYSVDFFNFSELQDNKVEATPEAWATFGYTPHLH